VLDLDDKKSGGHQKAPDLGDWLAYAQVLGWPKSDAEAAFDHYAANGWRVGGRAPMKDWKAAARNCHRRSSRNTNHARPEAGPLKVRELVKTL
jgi:hypothetical protein